VHSGILPAIGAIELIFLQTSSITCKTPEILRIKNVFLIDQWKSLKFPILVQNSRTCSVNKSPEYESNRENT
jgi:hypothetical protein